MSITITKLTKAGGPLTKRISLNKDGTLKSDGSACVMVRGRAQRVTLNSAQGLADLIETLRPCEAIALGMLRADLPDEVEVVTKEKITELNGVARPDMIARTGANIVYPDGEPAFVLLDYDTKGMPPAVEAELERHGGFWPALVSVLPELAEAGQVTRVSTSAGLYRDDTGKPVPGSDGVHIYIAVAEGADSERFLKTLHDRCWLAGLGWTMVGAGGQLLERSIVDRSVGLPERLCFEGAPILAPPLKQDTKARKPTAVSGFVLDSVAACPPLTIVERTRLEALKAREAQRLAPEAHRLRSAFIDGQAKELAQRTGKSMGEARRAIERQCEGFLHPDVVLPFDDPELAGCTVADVLADPERFVLETLADPLEGIEYGRCKAKIFHRSDGTLWINSFAHGGARYWLTRDAAAVRSAMQAAAKGDVIAVFVKLALEADLDVVEMAELRQLAKTLSGHTLGVIDRALDAGRQKQAEQRAKEKRAQAAAIANAGVALQDFYAYMQLHNYIFAPTGEMWPPASINARFPPVVVGADADGEAVAIEPSTWLDQNRPVEQITWAPGRAAVIEDFLISEGGWIARKGVFVYNLYRPATIELGDANAAGPWIDLVRKVFPKDAEHIFKYFAQRVQQPDVKINHALVLGSQDHGVGKDTMLEGVRRAVGAWNFKDIAPKDLFETFNPWTRAVILRINEVKDMGDVTRFELYEGMKRYLAAPPDTLPCNEKNIKQHYVLNCLAAIITTNHLTDGIYLPAEDRRHYVSWSDCKQSDFSREFWVDYWKWFDGGGDGHVAAYLTEFDISDFNPKAPPPKTPAFWAIVNANRTSEESELADVLDALGVVDADGNAERPDALLLTMITGRAAFKLQLWLEDPKNRKAVNYRLEACGYRAVSNPVAKDGYWRIRDRRQVIYAKITLSEGEQRAAAEALQQAVAEEVARAAAAAEEERLRKEKDEAAKRAEYEAWLKKVQAEDRKRAAEARKAGNGPNPKPTS